MRPKIKQFPNNFYKNTPIFWRKFGDSLLSVSVMVTVVAEANDVSWLVYTSLAIGVIGKFLTELFSDGDGDGVADITQG